MFRVVLIDDHPAVIMALTSILERDPVLKVVGTSGDGGEALALYREIKPDLLIIDLDIPGLGGLDLIRRVRNTDTAVKILVMSSSAPEFFAARCQSIGANGYISKSEDGAHILSCVKAAMAGFNCFPADIAVPATRDADDSAYSRLSEREQAVLRYLAQGRSNKEIGETLSLSSKTISSHKINILAKLGLTNIVDLAAFAKAHRIV
jgi:DNA-binding NarL/FixJ family response regulator